MSTIDLKALTAEIKAATITKDSRSGLNQLLKLAKAHCAVVTAYDKGDKADALVKAFKCGALDEDYSGNGRDLHAEALEELVRKIKRLLPQAVEAHKYWVPAV